MIQIYRAWVQGRAVLEIVEQSLYVIALIGEILLIAIGVNAIKSKNDKLAGSFLILAGVVGLSVLTGRTAFGFMVGVTVLALCLLGWYVTGVIKTTSQEKRRYPRAKITWPVVVMTPNGPVDGVTQNLSAGGAFILCSELPELDHDFHLFRSLILCGGYDDATHLVGHGLRGVQQEIEEDFLQLLNICIDVQVLGNLGEDFHSSFVRSSSTSTNIRA